MSTAFYVTLQRDQMHSRGRTRQTAQKRDATFGINKLLSVNQLIVRDAYQRFRAKHGD